MELILVISYLLALLTSVILLALRYLIVAVGVIFFPIGFVLVDKQVADSYKTYFEFLWKLAKK